MGQILRKRGPMIRASIQPVLRCRERALDFGIQASAACRISEKALRLFIAHADRLGVLVMVSGVVLNNNHCTLDPEEFRGLALANKQAPLASNSCREAKAAASVITEVT